MACVDGCEPLIVHVDSVSGHTWNLVLPFLYSKKSTPTNVLEAESIVRAGEFLQIAALSADGRRFVDAIDSFDHHLQSSTLTAQCWLTLITVM